MKRASDGTSMVRTASRRSSSSGESSSGSGPSASSRHSRLARVRLEPRLSRSRTRCKSLAVNLDRMSARIMASPDPRESGNRPAAGPSPEWQALVDALPIALCTLDARGRIRGVNRAFTALMETPADRLDGQPWLAVVPPGWAAAVQGAIEDSASDEEHIAQAGERAFRVRAFDVPGSEPGRRVLLFEDQTRQRRLQSQLIQSEKMSA